MESKSSNDGGSGPQDDYRFLGGIREVDDDEETLGGQRSASGNKSSNGAKSFGGSFKGSGGSKPHIEENKADHYYGTTPPIIDHTQNPFIQNLQQQALWSSGKSSSGEFGGNAFGTLSEPPLTTDKRSPSQDPESQRIEHYNRKVLTKFYNQSLAQMGEKACMRMAMKEMALILDDLNQIMCRQSVHQEIMMSEETGPHQMRQIMDLSLREQKSSAKRRHDRSVESDDIIDSKTEERLNSLKKKSNLQLIETLRMDSKMMEIRFQEFLSRESNIYNLYAKERERNEMLQNELLKYENSGSIDQGFPGRSPQAFQHMDSYSMSYQKDTVEKKNNNNLTINQLSPVSAFMQKQQHIQSLQEGVNQQVNNEQSDLQQVYLKLLDEKDKEINMLNDYVNNMKQEFQSLKQPELGQLIQGHNKMGSQRNLSSENSEFDKRSTLEIQQDKMIQLHTSIYNLKRQNSLIEAQMPHGISVQTAPIGNDQIIKLEQELSQLKEEMNEKRRLKLGGSSPGQKQGRSRDPSHENTGNTRAAYQRRVIEEEKFQSTSYSPSKLTGQMMVGGQTMDYPSDPASSQQTQQVAFAQHVSEPLVLAQQQQTSQEMKNLQKMAETLNIKLKETLEKNKDLQLKERHLTEKIQNREYEYAELRVLARDLQAQAKVNSEALEKAGKVIQKLNADLQQSLDAAAQIQNECERLKQDGHHNRKQLKEMDQTLQQQELANQGKIQRIDNELNLEINQLKEALGQYQSESDQDKIDMQQHIEDLQSQLNNQIAIQQSLEAKMIADAKAHREQLNKREKEILQLKDENISIKINMNKLETEIEQDIDVREQVNQRNNMFLKNQINDLHIKLQSQTQNHVTFKNENKQTEQDTSAPVPKINDSYVQTLSKEFTQLSDELLKLRSIFNSKSYEQLDSFLSQHQEQFNAFKLSVLDNLIDWHHKVTEHSRLANKYYDTLEEYKMLFVQMKQVINEKDNMLRNMRNHIESVSNIQDEKYSLMNCQLLDSNFDTMANLRKMTQALEHRIQIKETEVEELLRYQEEFRQEYLRTCQEKEGLFHDNHALSARVESLESDLMTRRKLDHEYKEKLRVSLEIVEGPHQYDVVLQYVQQVVETSKAQKLQIRHYQEKCEELTLEIENQRQIFQQKMADMERSLEESQKQYIDQQDEAQDNFLSKEQDLEKQILKLSEDLDRANQEVQLRERQIRKHESKVEDEIEKQRNLQVTIDELIQEQNRLKEANEAVNQTYDILEEKLKQSQEHLDQKVARVDQLDHELKQSYNRIDKLEVDLYNLDTENRQRSQDNEKLRNQTTNDVITLKTQSTKLRELEDLIKSLHSELEMIKASEHNLQEENLQQKQQLRESQSQQQTIFSQGEEIKQYQDSMAYLSRQIDEQTLAQLDIQLLKKERQHLQDEMAEKEAYINKFVHYPRASMATQTSDQGMAEIEMMSNEIYNLNQHAQEVLEEQEQLREAMRRQMNDIDRLIDEKRQLEKEIDIRNAKIFRLQHRESTFASENIDITNQRLRSNSPDTSYQIGHFASKSNYDMVLSEKQNYINKLEHELNDIRAENEKLKDKVIVYELENLGAKSMGARDNFNERTLADSNIHGNNRYSGEKYKKNYLTQKMAFGERPPRFEKTQQHMKSNQDRGGIPQSSFDRSLNFGLTSFHSSNQPDNIKPSRNQQHEFYTLNQSENEEQMTPYLMATNNEQSHRNDSPLRAAAKRFPNVQIQ